MSEQTVAGELIEKGLTIARIENDSIQAMAIQNKRNEVVVAEGALQELEIFPEYASKAFYSIPYKNDKGGTTNVEGPSIKSAMALARRWGNCSNAGRTMLASRRHPPPVLICTTGTPVVATLSASTCEAVSPSMAPIRARSRRASMVHMTRLVFPAPGEAIRFTATTLRSSRRR